MYLAATTIVIIGVLCLVSSGSLHRRKSGRVLVDVGLALVTFGLGWAVVQSVIAVVGHG